MSVEYISIKKVGPIEDVVLEDIRPFTVFIGPSASGKSTIMKVVALFRYLYKMANIRSYLHSSKIKQSPFHITKKNLLGNNDLADMFNDNSEIIYQNGDVKISFSNNKFSQLPSISKEDLVFQKGTFISEDRIVIPHWINQAGIRGIMLNFYLDETLQNFLYATTANSEYQLNYINMKLKVVTINNRKRYQLIDRKGKIVDLKSASSGIKTTVPLVVLADYFSNNFSFKDAFKRSVLNYLYAEDQLTKFSPSIEFTDMQKRIDVHVEEPELSLDPDAQFRLLDDLTRAVFHDISKDRKMSMMMTTHSPYILNYLNLLMAMYDDSAKKEIGINPEDLGAYRVFEGQAQSLMAEDDKGRKVVNSVYLSEQIEQIYLDYKEKRS